MLRIYGQFKVISKGDTKIELIRFLIEHKTHPEKISSDFFKKCVTIRQVDYMGFYKQMREMAMNQQLIIRGLMTRD